MASTTRLCSTRQTSVSLPCGGHNRCSARCCCLCSLAAHSSPVHTTTGAVTTAPAPVSEAPRVCGCMHRFQGHVEWTTTLGDTRAQWRISIIICGMDNAGREDFREESGTVRFSLVVSTTGSLERAWALDTDTLCLEQATVC